MKFLLLHKQRGTEPIKPHLTWNLVWKRTYWRHPQPREPKFWWKRNYGFFRIKRIYQWHAECYMPLLKVKGRNYPSPCTDCSFTKHWIIWFFIMTFLQRELAEGRVSDFSSTCWRMILTNKALKIKRSSQLRTLLKRTYGPEFFPGPIFNYSFQ